ncbi:Subtilisin-like protease SBT1-7 [Nymphaea thermarum]|nr:Subtilisin-like protease SBT1-7 [Nymphaea thermarum]
MGKVFLAVCLCFCFVLAHQVGGVASSRKQTYIVHTAKSQIPSSFTSHQEWYHTTLDSVLEEPVEQGVSRIIYTYSTVLHGFSARLTPAEAESLRGKHGVLAVLPEKVYHLHTTRTPEFLGLNDPNGLLPLSGNAGDVIIGVLDTGVWPESKSYNDDGFGPVPTSWKGECTTGKNFDASSCNRKLIGAQFFSAGYEAALGPIVEGKESRSPRDDDGHGTHTSTTAGGSVVNDASLFGYAFGNARGMAPRARIATYKVCWMGGCFSSDILRAMDKAIVDGVNVLSLSIGGGVSEYYRDSVAIGAFAAMEHGVFVSCSAGNAGPASSSLSNVAPWIMTVGAGTIDRDFPAYAVLGNGKNFSGVSLYSGKNLPDTATIPLIYAANASNSTSGNLCFQGTLVPEKVAGKIVLCDRGVTARVQKGAVVKAAGGAGMILANMESNGEELVADAHLLPAVGVGQKNGDAVRDYVLSDPHPMATIVIAGTKVGIEPSPVVAAFSSRGPNSITPGILKPDLIAPGVNILAGWSRSVGPTGLASDDRRVDFNIISGTSMSCPHVSGLAALLKVAHPDWSPSAIKSALMTTAYSSYKDGNPLLDVATKRPSTPLDHGAGHVDPQKALDPGLIYDLTTEDYLGFLCGLGYYPDEIALVARRNFTCSGSKITASNLNYPSFVALFDTAIEGRRGRVSAGQAAQSQTIRLTRTVTNVGSAASSYKVTVSAPEPVKAVVEPDVLSFTAKGETKSYTVSLTSSSLPSGTSKFGYLEWSDGQHLVRSPIALTWT